jgi:2-alkenal reductase
VDIVNRIAAELIKQGHVPTPGIGIVAASQTTSRVGTDGVITYALYREKPAHNVKKREISPRRSQGPRPVSRRFNFASKPAQA